MRGICFINYPLLEYISIMFGDSFIDDLTITKN